MRNNFPFFRRCIIFSAFWFQTFGDVHFGWRLPFWRHTKFWDIYHTELPENNEALMGVNGNVW